MRKIATDCKLSEMRFVGYDDDYAFPCLLRREKEKRERGREKRSGDQLPGFPSFIVLSIRIVVVFFLVWCGRAQMPRSLARQTEL